MQPVMHTYPSRIRAMIWFLVVFSLLAIIYLFFTLPSGSKIVGFFFTAVVLFNVAYFWNMYPEIMVEEDGVLVHFFSWWLPVKWEDIVDVRQYSLIGFLRRVLRIRSKGSLIVRTRSLTLFHRFYDNRFFSFSPTFYIHSSISEYDELLSILENKKLIQTSEKLTV
jgi:hypothetical protein